MTTKDALIIVDVQKDFCPGGSLAVPNGDAVVPILNNYIKLFDYLNLPIFYSRDIHPANTKHFDLWPDHCVVDTPGVEFHNDLILSDELYHIAKGTDTESDAYSAFDGCLQVYDNIKLIYALRLLGVTNLFIGGLATDYCVKATCMDGKNKFGLNVCLLKDGSRAVNVNSGDGAESVKEMFNSGIDIITYNDIFNKLSE